MRTRDQIMQEWDAVRAKIASGCTNSGPRDWLEGVLDDLVATERVNGHATHGWQPIDTAPTDGTPVLVSNADHPWVGLSFTARYIDGRWRAHFGGDFWQTFDPEPKHWLNSKREAAIMSSTERIANEFDLELHRLMRRAEWLSSDSRVKREADAWKVVASLLGRARLQTTSMMHQSDDTTSSS